MQPDDTPRQPEAHHNETFPAAPPRRRPRGFGAGECGDAIWECPAGEGEVPEAYPPHDESGEPRTATPPDGGVRGGRFIDLIERRGRQE